MSRVEAASGAKYSVHKETARKSEPIAPVGTSYIPVGKPDIDAMRRASNAPSQAQAPPPPPATRPVPAAPRSVPPAPAVSYRPSPVVNKASAPDDAWDEPAARFQPSPSPAAARPPVISAARPTPAVSIYFVLWDLNSSYLRRL
jgi:drebrin-like protein